MLNAYEIVNKNAKKSTERGKQNYDKKAKSSVLEEGDRVLVRNMTPRGGTGKLRSHWEDCIHKVVRQVNKDLPIYEVVPEQGKVRDSRSYTVTFCSQLARSGKKNKGREKKETSAPEFESSSDDDYDW